VASVKSKARALANRPAGPLRDLRWWLKDKPEQAVWDNYKRIGKRTHGIRSRDNFYACLYDDVELATALIGMGAIGEFTPQTMATNIIRRQVDTYVAKIAKNRPVPMGLTSGGNYSQQRRAKSISKFFEGILDKVEFWPTRTLRLRDAGVVGSGLALNYRVGRRMVHDRIFKKEVRVDPVDAERGKPRTLYIGRLVDKLVLAERFPEHAEKIFEADSDAGDASGSRTIVTDDMEHLALVIECWHLPSGEIVDGKKGDGAHAICISNATLALGEYRRPNFPVSKFDYSPPTAGYFGSGIAQQLEGLQYEVNSVGLRLQERHYLMGTYVLVDDESEIVYETIDNGTLTEVRCAGGKRPEFVSPPAAGADLFNWYQMIRTQMPAEITGISGMSTRSEKPAGLDSGKAIRTYHEIDSENLTTQGRADEQDVIDTCWQFFDLAEEIYAETKKEPEDGKEKPKPYMVRAEVRKHGRSVLEELDYAEVRLDKEQFTLRTFPTNFLRGTPEEQMQSVNEMIEAGFLSQDEALILLDFPDLQRVLNLRTAARHIIERTLEKFLDAKDPNADGVYVYPEPPMGLELCKALALMTYLDEKLNGAPEANLKLVMQFYLDAETELQKAKAKAAAEQMPSGAPAPPGGLPTDAGGPPPMDPGMPPPDAQYAPPQAPLLPEGAVPPDAIQALPPGAQ
jgi:hypothetical protein